jgi:DNA-binding HxlR family transcriptional regulator
MLLLLRDLAHAPMRFTDLQVINPKISPNLLSKRLRRLQDAGLAAKRELPPPAAATVYELRPEAGDAVLPVLNALGRFGAHLFQAAPAAPVDALLEQMRLIAAEPRCLIASPGLEPGGAQAGTPAWPAAAARSSKPRMSAIRPPRKVRTCQRSTTPPTS